DRPRQLIPRAAWLHNSCSVWRAIRVLGSGTIPQSMLYRFSLIALFCTNVYAQLFYFGVTGRTPLSDSTSSALVFDRFSGGGLSTLNVRRYTLGPTFEVALPLGLRFEADALYKRLDTTGHSFLGEGYGRINRESASPWEFPLLLKYPFGRGRYRPFV